MGGISLDNLNMQNDINTLKQYDGVTHEPGFEPQQGCSENLSDFGFSDLSGLEQYSQSTFGAPNATTGNMGEFGNALEQQQQQQQQASAAHDWVDTAVTTAGKGAAAAGRLFIEIIKSAGYRTVDDIGYFGSMSLKVSIAITIAGALMLLMAGLTGWSGFGARGLGGTIFLSGLLTGGVGAITLSIAAAYKSQNPEQVEKAVAELPDVQDQEVEKYVANIEDSVDNIVTDDLMSELDEILGNDYTAEDIAEPKYEEPEEVSVMPDFDALDRKMASEKRTITRANLITTFLPYFMQKTPQFRESVDIEPGSPTYDALRTVIIKAVANLQNIAIEKVPEQLLSARETFFSYKIVFERVKKLKNTKDLERELETYFRATVNDPNLSEEDIKKQRLRIKATVEAAADTWEITINKGNSGIITVGDCLAGSRELDYFKNEKNALPLIAGITESGSVILEDGQYLDNIMVSGKQRSGKSWYVNALLTSMLAFNSPEEIALIIIDPKNSTMFNTLALFPHVIGIHDGRTINDIFREVIDIEAVRRAEKLRESRCENIKDYNTAHPDARIPRLFIVIDEVISVRDGLMQGDEKEGKQRIKEFNSSMLTIMSKLPYVGIGLIFIPHRATGIIDKTARTLLKLKAAVMAEDDEIDETLGEKIDRRLTAPGDIAMRAVSMESARYVRGPAVADDDMKTAETLRRIAKGFYSMGVEVPKWDNLTISYIDNSEQIKSELFGNINRIQY